ncbi:hypothetical protein LJK88_32420 [Paenibacillus sp. P26]|nr:hypothetical protein LJK88_32420 [Paenibacillus sp. P26]
MKEPVRFSIIVPVYNEEAVIHETYRRLKEVMHRTGETYGCCSSTTEAATGPRT